MVIDGDGAHDEKHGGQASRIVCKGFEREYVHADWLTSRDVKMSVLPVM